jgi:hypothetical protein
LSVVVVSAVVMCVAILFCAMLAHTIHRSGRGKRQVER